MPFDLSEATHLFPTPNSLLSTSQLISLRSRQLMKREDDIQHYRTQISRRRFLAAHTYEEKYKATIHNYDFKPGRLVLIRDKRLDNDFDKKFLPRYNGPYIIISRRPNGPYCVAELDGTVSKLRIAASRVVPFHHRPHSLPIPIPLTDGSPHATPLDSEVEEGAELTEDSQH